MKKILISIILLIGFWGFSQNQKYSYLGIEGIIFNSSYNNIFTIGKEKKYTPTRKEINLLEIKIRGKYLNYVRQYYGFYEKNRKKIGVLLISKESLKRNKNWQKEPLFMMGGGNDYITLIYDVDKKEITSLSMNTIE